VLKKRKKCVHSAVLKTFEVDGIKTGDWYICLREQRKNGKIRAFLHNFTASHCPVVDNAVLLW
jgi:hypothetical protein